MGTCSRASVAAFVVFSLAACLKVTTGTGQVLCDGSPCQDDPSLLGTAGSSSSPGSTGTPGNSTDPGKVPGSAPNGSTCAIDSDCSSGRCVNGACSGGSGTPGSTGTPGTAGTAGTPGVAGTVGTPGSPGTPGNGCATGPQGGAARGTVSGSASATGVTVTAQDGFALTASGQDGIAIITRWASLGLFLTSYPNACGYHMAQGAPATGKYMALNLYLSSTSRAVAISPGTYSVTPTATDPRQDPMEPRLTVSDDKCSTQGLGLRGPVTGNLVITSISSTRVAGSVNINGQSGDKIFSTFDVPICPGPQEAGGAGDSRFHDIGARCCMPAP